MKRLCGMHCARLNQRVDIQAATTPTTGETNPSFAVHVANVPAEIRETGGGEYIRGRQVEAGVTAVITIRYRSDLSPTMRVRYGDRTLELVSVGDPTGHRVYLVLTCKELDT